MWAIVTKINPDGTFDTVGMRNRMVVSDLKTERGILKRAREFARGNTFKVEFYASTHSERCIKVMTETTVKPPVTR